jgi:hypothetical protein
MTDLSDDPGEQLAKAIHTDAEADVSKPTLLDEIQELRAFDVPFDAVENHLRSKYDATEVVVKTLPRDFPTVPDVAKQLEAGDAIGVGITPAEPELYVVSGRVALATDHPDGLGRCVDTSGWRVSPEGELSSFSPGDVTLERDGAKVSARRENTDQELGRVLKIKTGAIVDPSDFIPDDVREGSL